MRTLVLGLILGLAIASPAAAQQGWTLTREGDSFAFQISDRTPIPTVDELVARMREQLENWPRLANAPIRPGDVIITEQTSVERVGRLIEDVTRIDEEGRRRLLMPRGTAVYLLAYDYDSFVAGGNPGDSRWTMWCGRAPRVAAADAGYCVRFGGDRQPAYATIPAGQSIMLPTGMQTLNTASEPQVDETDASARAEFPPTELRYVLQDVNAERLQIMAIMQVDGQSRERPINARRSADGSAVFRDTSIAARLAPAAADAFRVELIEPSEAPLREFAENLVQQVQAQRAGRN